MLDYRNPMQIKKHNIGIEEMPKMAIVEDY